MMDLSRTAESDYLRLGPQLSMSFTLITDRWKSH